MLSAKTSDMYGGRRHAQDLRRQHMCGSKGRRVGCEFKRVFEDCRFGGCGGGVTQFGLDVHLNVVRKLEAFGFALRVEEHYPAQLRKPSTVPIVDGRGKTTKHTHRLLSGRWCARGPRRRSPGLPSRHALVRRGCLQYGLHVSSIIPFKLRH